MKINERWEYLKEASRANIQSEQGILKRKNRFLQHEIEKYEGKTDEKTA